jgi:hypothetical protein
VDSNIYIRDSSFTILCHYILGIRHIKDVTCPFKFKSTFRILDWLILIVYSIVTFSFLPLFFSIMTLMQVCLHELYARIRFRIISMFTVFILFLTTRLFLYADLKFFRLFFKKTTIYSAIPFYATEVIIALSLSYVLYVTSEIEHEGRQRETER